MKRGGLQNQSVAKEIGKNSPSSNRNILPSGSVATIFDFVLQQDPVVAPAGIGLRAGSTQRPLLDVVGPGIEHFTRTLTLERGIAI